MKPFDGLRSFMESNSKPNEEVTTKETIPLISELERVWEEKGELEKTYLENTGATVLMHYIPFKDYLYRILIIEETGQSVDGYVSHPMDFEGMAPDVIEQILKETEKLMNLSHGRIEYAAEIRLVHYIHHFHRTHFYPYEDLPEQLISLFEQEAEIVLNVFEEIVEKYGL